jgi:nitroreductase
MEFRDVVNARFSTRKFKADPISDATLNKVLEAARRAPSWANVQATRYVLVKNQDLKKQLAECLTPKNPATNAVVSAPVVIVLCYVKGESGYYKGKALNSLEGQWGLFDAGLAAANLTLAAVDQGLGTVHAGAVNLEKVAEVLSLPEQMQVVELIPIGVPNQENNSPKRKDLSELVLHRP